jgi:hypothetical protein
LNLTSKTLNNGLYVYKYKAWWKSIYIS